jgi:alpha-beta hydrolase superfamily lysophospholipase
MIHDENTFSNANGASIFYQSWKPDYAPRAVFIVVHGVAEHSGRYERFAKHFVERDFAVTALDHPGHGRSDGRPGHVDRFSEYIQSLDQLRTMIAHEMPSVPQILLGHSMGGLIGASYLLQNQDAFIGCILSGPAIKTDVEPSALQMALIRFLSWALPQTGALQLDSRGVSRDPEEVKRYVEDPLVYNGKLSARLVAELFNEMVHVQSQASTITLPLLVLHGGEDAMASPEGSRFLVDHVRSLNKKLEIYPGLFHEIFNEPEREQVFEDILHWCEELLGHD